MQIGPVLHPEAVKTRVGGAKTPCFAPRGCPSRNRRGRKGPGSVGMDEGAEVFAEAGGEEVGAFLGLNEI